MEKNAAQILGEDVIASSPVMPSGYAKNIASHVAGTYAGGAIGAAAAGALNRRGAEPITPGDHKGNIFMVVTPTRLAFFEQKQGLLRRSLGRLLAEHPREEVSNFNLEGKGMTNSALTIELADGTTYGLAVPRVQRGKASKVAAEFEGLASGEVPAT